MNEFEIDSFLAEDRFLGLAESPNKHIEIYLNDKNPALLKGQLGTQQIPLFKMGDLKRNANYKGVDGLRANRAAAAAKTSKSQPVQTKQITLIGVGTLKTYFEPSSFELKVSNDLTGLGWTITGTSLKNVVNFDDKTQWLRFASPLLGYVAPTWNYSIHISISALASHNPEEIKNRVANYLAQYFSDLKLAVAGQTFDNEIPQSNSGGYQPNGNPPPSGKSLLDDLFGKIGLELGVSATTALLVGGVFVVLMFKK
jgi:hypothetical protein